MTKTDWDYRQVCRMTDMFSCFMIKEYSFPPDVDGQRYSFYCLDVDERRLADIRRNSNWSFLSDV